MRDLIDRQAAIDALESEKTYCTAFRDGYTPTNVFEKYNAGISDGIKALKRLPTAERKKGKWISKYNGKPVKVINGIPQESCACSVCGKWLIASDEYGVNGNYCPNCGARMVDDDIS